MGVIRGTIQDGKVVFGTPTGWPEGKEVLVLDPDDASKLIPTPPVPMMADEEQGDDPESIAKWLAWYDSLEPLVLTPEDEDRIRKAREEQKAFELARWEEHSKKLEKLFE